MKWYDFSKYKPALDSLCIVQFDFTGHDGPGADIQYTVADFPAIPGENAEEFLLYTTDFLFDEGIYVHDFITKWAYLEEPK